MPHPTITNGTPFHFEHLIMQDENLRPLFVGVLKATFRIHPTGQLTPLKEQPGLNVEGEFFGEPETTGYKYEPECAPVKLNTDIVLIGKAIPPQPDMHFFDCGIQVGNYSKIVRIFGKRQWQQTDEGGQFIQQLEPAQATELDYANAFGGKDESLETEFGHPFDERNPIGLGYHHPDSEFQAEAALPLIENPKQLIESFHDTPEPAGVSFVGPHWLQRRQYAGTYDEQWEQNRSPLLPKDFNRQFHNAASPGLITSVYLPGNETVSLVNVGQQKLIFKLPAMQQPKMLLELEHEDHILPLQLDTVITNADEMILSLIYRCHYVLQRGAHDVHALSVKVPGISVESLAVV
ncbi:MAG: DUF2169 domain-containing protein [Pseudomonadales bacterium]|nr:DUF2169 domain-containing protein [Pseudomonadales bacterium]